MKVKCGRQLWIAVMLAILGTTDTRASEQIDYRAQIDAANRKVHETLALQDAAATPGSTRWMAGCFRPTRIL